MPLLRVAEILAVLMGWTLAASMGREQSCADTREDCSSSSGDDTVGLLQHSMRDVNKQQISTESKLSENDVEHLLPDLKKIFGDSQTSEEMWDKASEFAERKLEIQRVANDGGISQFAYAKTGDNIPKSLHGIFWLDQFHDSSIAKTEAYRRGTPLP